jgi:hypothetical protein
MSFFPRHSIARAFLLTLQFSIATVQFVVAILYNWAEMSQHLHILAKVDPIVSAINEKCMHNAIT